MAIRRMFSKIITNSDPFLEMPASSQNLYFHLGMNADDDGFVQVKSIMKQLGAADDDLRVLLTKGFLIRFADGVIVITAWKVNNEIRGDRYKPTYYQEHMEKLSIEINRCYSLRPETPEIISVNSMVVPDDNQMTTRCLPVGDTDQVSIDQVSIGKNKESGQMSGQTSPEIEIETKLEIELEKKSSKHEFPLEIITLTQKLYDGLVKPTRWNKKPPDLNEWAVQLDRLNRLDGISYELMGSVIEFIARYDKWKWREVIQSGEGFRKNFDQIEKQMKKNRVQTSGDMKNDVDYYEKKIQELKK